ncbi:hypothetical protein [Halomarina oriensis]|uniref:Uncharacterized protein n=1 Tax=Halomarina oriensis TaxID=671145 RepID=A0A6B0GXQ3_9EURY|nr:hypothetical protein [Halomarina oriensis]MWG36558.1 hypothetical protein [Halomarina oriensis]
MSDDQTQTAGTDFSEEAVKTMKAAIQNSITQYEAAEDGSSEARRIEQGLLRDIARVCDAYDVIGPEQRLTLAVEAFRRVAYENAESAVATFAEDLNAQMRLFGGERGDE